MKSFKAYVFDFVASKVIIEIVNTGWSLSTL